MREVLISIQPKWVEKIVSGEKTVEVRKTKPKLDTPFKVYIYETNWRDNTYWKHQHKGRLGKVIGEFVCDSIIVARCGSYCKIPTKLSQVDAIDLMDYADGKTVYGWHITDLVVYDEPRELRDFKPYNRTEEDCKFSHLGLAIPKCKDCRECYVKRPYQSWGYVEATEPRQTAD